MAMMTRENSRIVELPLHFFYEYCLLCVCNLIKNIVTQVKIPGIFSFNASFKRIDCLPCILTEIHIYFCSASVFKIFFQLPLMRYKDFPVNVNSHKKQFFT